MTHNANFYAATYCAVPVWPLCATSFHKSALPVLIAAYRYFLSGNILADEHS